MTTALQEGAPICLCWLGNLEHQPTFHKSPMADANGLSVMAYQRIHHKCPNVTTVATRYGKVDLLF